MWGSFWRIDIQSHAVSHGTKKMLVMCVIYSEDGYIVRDVIAFSNTIQYLCDGIL